VHDFEAAQSLTISLGKGRGNRAQKGMFLKSER